MVDLRLKPRKSGLSVTRLALVSIVVTATKGYRSIKIWLIVNKMCCKCKIYTELHLVRKGM